MQKSAVDKHSVEALTGPVMLFHTYRKYGKLYGVKLLDPTVIYPYSWGDQKGMKEICSAQSVEFDADSCKKNLTTDASHAITYWSHSWEGPENLVIQSRRRRSN